MDLHWCGPLQPQALCHSSFLAQGEGAGTLLSISLLQATSSQPAWWLLASLVSGSCCSLLAEVWLLSQNSHAAWICPCSPAWLKLSSSPCHHLCLSLGSRLHSWPIRYHSLDQCSLTHTSHCDTKLPWNRRRLKWQCADLRDLCIYLWITVFKRIITQLVLGRGWDLWNCPR